MSRTLDIDVLKAVLAVAKTGGFTAAAKRLYRTQTTISGQVKRLEEQLGIRIFARHSKSAQLTVEGERLVGFASSMVSLNERALEHFSKARRRESIRVGVPEGYAVRFLAPAVSRFLAQSAVVDIEMECNHSPVLLERLDSGKLDLVIATEQANRSDGEMLARSLLAWVGNGSFSHEEGREVSLSLYPAGLCAHRAIAIQTLNRHRVPWRVALSSSHLDGLLAPVRAGLAVTVLPEESVPPGMFEPLPLQSLPTLPTTGVSLHASRRLSAAATQLRSIILDLRKDRVRMSVNSSANVGRQLPALPHGDVAEHV